MASKKTETPEPVEQAEAHFETFDVRIEGASPLLMHSGALADPEGEPAMELRKYTSKKSKTPDDFKQIRWREFLGGAYWDDKAKHFFIPAANVEATLRDAAYRTGANRKTFLASIFCEDVQIPLEYDGPKTPEDRFVEKCYLQSGVKVRNARVMRVRPIFDRWALGFGLVVNTAHASPDSVSRALAHAGALVGIGDWRPKFGRFTVPEFKKRS